MRNQDELRSEYESTYLAYILWTHPPISFEDWLVSYKGYKPKNKTKQQLIDRVLECIEDDCKHGDLTVLEELLKMLPANKLIGSLDEREWIIYDKVKK